jgi:hypothetical protein
MAGLSVLRLALVVILAFALICGRARAEGPACNQPLDVCAGQVEGTFPLIAGGVPVAVITDAADWPGVLRAAGHLATDLSELARGEAAAGEFVIIAGTLGRSAEIDRLVAEGRLDVSAIEGVWEGYVQAVVDAPSEGVKRALVIAGADKRGTIYGLYDLSERAGVSPWAWWADVPVPHRPDLSVLPGSRADWPRVKYRGIFINDEKPALHGWVNHHYGGFKSGFYERVFELILRNKGNYLWPAMWGESIYDDDPLTGPLADEMGVVIGKSHHEPMGRAHVEWARYGEGRWDYTSNEEVLRDFWRAGIERLKDWETIVTLGMRGDGDEAMTEGTAIGLLERIVSDQRAIIAEVTGKPAAEQPSIWALYKEVQDYYDQGMQVPDDITLLFADDNWGNIRRLPKPGSERPGGYGVYYHFDYVGGPRNYKWLNTNQIERVWEQMNLAWEYGARQIWIVNVGDIKPMEFPISFFLDQAWNPEAMPRERMSAYTRAWAAQQFTEEHSAEIAQITELYTKYASRRKHELVDPETFSVVNFDEFRRVTAELEDLAARADGVRAVLPRDYDDAYVQLVWFPVQATANLYRLYEAVALNRLYAAQGRAADARAQAERAEKFYAHDAELTRIYHEDVADGKWVHMMSQTHIGYTYWQQPEEQVMPAVERPDVLAKGAVGVAVEGDRRGWWLGEKGAALPLSDVFAQQVRWIDVFNSGAEPLTARVSAREDWIQIAEGKRSVSGSERIEVRIDWEKVPEGRHTGEIRVRSGGWESLKIAVPVNKPRGWDAVKGYPLAGGFVAIEAAAASRTSESVDARWSVIPNLGRTGDGITLVPGTAPVFEPGSAAAPRLEYDLHLFEAKPVTVEVELAPTLDFKGDGGMRFALSLGASDPVIVNVHAQLTPADWSESHWEATVAKNSHHHTVTFPDVAAGAQTLTLWAIDAPLVFQKLVVSQEAVPESYLGPPVSAPR